jgi:hypothetical protein
VTNEQEAVAVECADPIGRGVGKHVQLE